MPPRARHHADNRLPPGILLGPYCPGKQGSRFFLVLCPTLRNLPCVANQRNLQRQPNDVIKLLRPSCVALDPGGYIFAGHTARNSAAADAPPDSRVARSVSKQPVAISQAPEAKLYNRGEPGSCGGTMDSKFFARRKCNAPMVIRAVGSTFLLSLMLPHDTLPLLMSAGPWRGALS